jgi:hypothetical protein
MKQEFREVKRIIYYHTAHLVEADPSVEGLIAFVYSSCLGPSKRVTQ